MSTQPPDVDVWLGEQKLGSSRKPVEVPSGSEPIELVLKKSGYADKPLKLTPDREQRHDNIRLVARVAAPAPRSKPRPKPATQPTSQPTSQPGGLDGILGARD